jgi:hypothetical protein
MNNRCINRCTEAQAVAVYRATLTIMSPKRFAVAAGILSGRNTDRTNYFQDLERFIRFADGHGGCYGVQWRALE